MINTLRTVINGHQLYVYLYLMVEIDVIEMVFPELYAFRHNHNFLVIKILQKDIFCCKSKCIIMLKELNFLNILERLERP